MRIEFSLIDADFRRTIDRLIEGGSDLTPLMEELAGHLGAGVEESFESESDPVTGTPWADLRPATVRERERKGYWPGKILQRTGMLAMSLVSEAGPDFAEVSVGEDYGIWPQDGTRRMARRRFMGISPDTATAIVQSTLDYLDRLLEG